LGNLIVGLIQRGGPAPDHRKGGQTRHSDLTHRTLLNLRVTPCWKSEFPPFRKGREKGGATCNLPNFHPVLDANGGQAAPAGPTFNLVLKPNFMHLLPSPRVKN
jgi:hypothetical protein